MSFLQHSTQMIFWRGIGISTSVLTAVFLARILGPEDRGVLAIIIYSITMGTLMLQLGFPEALIYIIGQKLYPESSILSTILNYNLILVITTAFPGYLTLYYFFGMSETRAIIVIISIIVSIPLTFGRHILLAKKQFNYYSYSVVFELTLYLMLIALFTIWLEISINFVLISYAISLSITLIILTIYFFKMYTLEIKPKFEINILKLCFKHGIHLFATGFGGFFIQRINYYFLELFSGTRSVGLYTVANSLPSIFSAVPQQLATVIYSHSSGEKDDSNRVHLTIKIFCLVFVVSLFIIIPMCFYAESIVLIVFGDAYAGTGKAMIILTISMTLAGLTSLLFNSIAGAGLHKYGTVVLFINIITLSISGFILIPKNNFEGAAISVLITSFVSFVYIIIVFITKNPKFHLKSFLGYGK